MGMLDNNFKKIILTIITLLVIVLLILYKYEKIRIIPKNLNQIISNEDTNRFNEEESFNKNKYIEMLKEIRGINYLVEELDEYNLENSNNILIYSKNGELKGPITESNRKERSNITKEELEKNIESILTNYKLENISKEKSEYIMEGMSDLKNNQNSDYVIIYTASKMIDNNIYNFKIKTRNITNSDKSLTNLNSYIEIQINN